MSRKISILESKALHHETDHSVTGWIVRFRHSDSVKTTDKVTVKLDVMAHVTPTEIYVGLNGIKEDIVQVCKDYVNNSGPFAGGAYANGEYNAETWTN